MTILDDAIREHLELKRKHGAGDSEVKQLEDEAFGPAERPGEAASAEAPSAPDPYAVPPPDMRPAAEVATPPPVETGEVDRAPETPPIAADGDGEPAGVFDHQVAAPRPTEAVQPPESPPAAQTQAPTPEPQAPEAPEQVFPETAEQPPPIPPEEPTPTPEPTPPQPSPPPAAEAPMPSAEPAVEPVVVPPTPAEPEQEYVEPEHEYFQPESEEGEEEASDEIPFADLDLSLDDEEEEIELGTSEPESDEQAPDEQAPEEDTGPFAALLEDETEPAAAGQGHDVLEETPDFLKDVPENEELWFEQRPPKDFDFGD